MCRHMSVHQGFVDGHKRWGTSNSHAHGRTQPGEHSSYYTPAGAKGDHTVQVTATAQGIIDSGFMWTLFWPGAIVQLFCLFSRALQL